MVELASKQVIRALKEKGMTQRQLASVFGMSPSYVNQILMGTKPIEPRIAIYIERTLNIPASKILRDQADYNLTQYAFHYQDELNPMPDKSTKRGGNKGKGKIAKLNPEILRRLENGDSVQNLAKCFHISVTDILLNLQEWGHELAT